MDKNINKVLLVGNVTKDPDVRITPSGKKVATVTVATSTGWKDANTGEYKDYTEFHNVVAWGKLADMCDEGAITKGSKVYVNGSLTTTSWNDKNGSKRYMTQVKADELVLLSSKRQSEESVSDELPFD